MENIHSRQYPQDTEMPKEKVRKENREEEKRKGEEKWRKRRAGGERRS